MSNTKHWLGCDQKLSIFRILENNMAAVFCGFCIYLLIHKELRNLSRHYQMHLCSVKNEKWKLTITWVLIWQTIKHWLQSLSFYFQLKSCLTDILILDIMVHIFSLKVSPVASTLRSHDSVIMQQCQGSCKLITCCKNKVRNDSHYSRYGMMNQV